MNHAKETDTIPFKKVKENFFRIHLRDQICKKKHMSIKKNKISNHTFCFNLDAFHSMLFYFNINFFVFYCQVCRNL